ncbi:hypothetical protein Hanom_Chr10g00921901 [Helianthus anomalus]
MGQKRNTKPPKRQANYKEPTTKNKQKKLPKNPSLQWMANLQESGTTVQQTKEKILKDSLSDGIAYLKANKSHHNPNTSIPKKVFTST